MVAGLGSRSPVKRDYEPRNILTFHPHINKQPQFYYWGGDLAMTDKVQFRL